MAGNLPNVTFRWTRQAACREFNLADETLQKRFAEARESPAPDGTYGTLQITNALFSGNTSLRERKLEEEVAKLELENRITRADFLSRSELVRAFGRLADGVKQIVANSGLSREDADELLENISGFAVILDDTARRQSRLRTAKDKNGSESPKAKKKAGTQAQDKG